MRWQVDEEEIDRPARQERATDRQALVQRLGGDHDEPLRPDPSGECLDWVEAPGQIEPGNDGPCGLGFRNEAEGDRGLSARSLPTECDTG
jgi:hypothetical protein